MVVNLPAKQEAQVQFLGREGLLEKGTTEDKLVGWHHRLNGLEFE